MSYRRRSNQQKGQSADNLEAVDANQERVSNLTSSISVGLSSSRLLPIFEGGPSQCVNSARLVDPWTDDSCRDFLVAQTVTHLFYYHFYLKATSLVPHVITADSEKKEEQQQSGEGVVSACCPRISLALHVDDFQKACAASMDLKGLVSRVAHLPAFGLAYAEYLKKSVAAATAGQTTSDDGVRPYSPTSPLSSALACAACTLPNNSLNNSTSSPTVCGAGMTAGECGHRAAPDMYELPTACTLVNFFAVLTGQFPSNSSFVWHNTSAISQAVPKPSQPFQKKSAGNNSCPHHNPLLRGRIPIAPAATTASQARKSATPFNSSVGRGATPVVGGSRLRAGDGERPTSVPPMTPLGGARCESATPAPQSSIALALSTPTPQPVITDTALAGRAAIAPKALKFLDEDDAQDDECDKGTAPAKEKVNGDVTVGEKGGDVDVAQEGFSFENVSFCCPGCVADIAAHFLNLLIKNVVMERWSVKDMQFICWLLGRGAAVTLLNPPPAGATSNSLFGSRIRDSPKGSPSSAVGNGITSTPQKQTQQGAKGVESPATLHGTPIPRAGNPNVSASALLSSAVGATSIAVDVRSQTPRPVAPATPTREDEQKPPQSVFPFQLPTARREALTNILKSLYYDTLRKGKGKGKGAKEAREEDNENITGQDPSGNSSEPSISLPSTGQCLTFSEIAALFSSHPSVSSSSSSPPSSPYSGVDTWNSSNNSSGLRIVLEAIETSPILVLQALLRSPIGKTSVGGDDNTAANTNTAPRLTEDALSKDGNGVIPKQDEDDDNMSCSSAASSVLSVGGRRMRRAAKRSRVLAEAEDKIIMKGSSARQSVAAVTHTPAADDAYTQKNNEDSLAASPVIDTHKKPSVEQKADEAPKKVFVPEVRPTVRRFANSSTCISANDNDNDDAKTETKREEEEEGEAVLESSNVPITSTDAATEMVKGAEKPSSSSSVFQIPTAEAMANMSDAQLAAALAVHVNTRSKNKNPPSARLSAGAGVAIDYGNNPQDGEDVKATTRHDRDNNTLLAKNGQEATAAKGRRKNVDDPTAAATHREPTDAAAIAAVVTSNPSSYGYIKVPCLEADRVWMYDNRGLAEKRKQWLEIQKAAAKQLLEKIDVAEVLRRQALNKTNKLVPCSGQSDSITASCIPLAPHNGEATLASLPPLPTGEKNKRKLHHTSVPQRERQTNGGKESNLSGISLCIDEFGRKALKAFFEVVADEKDSDEESEGSGDDDNPNDDSRHDDECGINWEDTYSPKDGAPRMGFLRFACRRRGGLPVYDYFDSEKEYQK